MRNTLEQQCAALGLGDDVIFTGSRRDLDRVYPALDIVALTSRNEGTPLTLIEAMANARPVISTAVGGVIDLLGESNSLDANEPFKICQRGLSVPPDDPSAFAAGLERLIADPTLRRETGERGLQFVISHYSTRRLLTDMKRLYTELLLGKGFQFTSAGASPPGPRAD
jgi:glycosyltransferase involved in cell wall biosynthesis